MGLSNSTLHWLEDGDQAVPGRLTEPGSMASYDPRAPVPGRRRAVLVVGLAGAVALIVAGTLFVNAQKRRAAEPPAPAVDRTCPRSDQPRRSRAGRQQGRRGAGAGPPGAGRRPAFCGRALRRRRLQEGAQPEHRGARRVPQVSRARAARNARRRRAHRALDAAAVTAPRTPPARRLSLADVRARYVEAGRALPAGLEAALAADRRAGAQAILAAVERRRRANRVGGAAAAHDAALRNRPLDHRRRARRRGRRGRA